MLRLDLIISESRIFLRDLSRIHKTQEIDTFKTQENILKFRTVYIIYRTFDTGLTSELCASPG